MSRLLPILAIRQALRALRAGGLVAYPTEAVYGLGCDPDNPAALRRLLALKRRPPAKGLILIAADPEQLSPYLAPLTPVQRDTLLASWPGPVTWLVPARASVPERLRGAHDTVAVRVTAHPVAAALCRAFGGALVSTSANLAGRPPARSAHQVRLRLGRFLDAVVPGPTGGAARPTAIRDLRSGRVIRAG